MIGGQIKSRLLAFFLWSTSFCPWCFRLQLPSVPTENRAGWGWRILQVKRLKVKTDFHCLAVVLYSTLLSLYLPWTVNAKIGAFLALNLCSFADLWTFPNISCLLFSSFWCFLHNPLNLLGVLQFEFPWYRMWCLNVLFKSWVHDILLIVPGPADRIPG